nr:unnamed protein product [Callosobruchus chinensis]
MSSASEHTATYTTTTHYSKQMSFEEIITEIQIKPELWMSSHPLFKNRIIKSKSWKELAEKLHIEGSAEKALETPERPIQKRAKKTTSSKIWGRGGCMGFNLAIL